MRSKEITAEMIAEKLEAMESQGTLKDHGWVRENLGQYRSNGEIKDKKGFRIYVRKRLLKEFLDDCFEKSSKGEAGNPQNTTVSGMGSNKSFGEQKDNLTPSAEPEGSGSLLSSGEADKSLPVLSHFSDFPSLAVLRENRPDCLAIGFDSEWQTRKCGRNMLSWQFALVVDVYLVEVIFIKEDERDLSLMEALGFILDHFGKVDPVDVRSVRKYKYCKEWSAGEAVEMVTKDVETAKKNCRYVYRGEKVGFTKELIEKMPQSWSADDNWECYHTYDDFGSIQKLKVTLVCHAGKVDLSSLDFGDQNLLKSLTEVQGGLVSMQPIRYDIPSLKNVNNTKLYPVSLSVSDTMCHTPAKKKRLEDLGKTLGIRKIDLEKDVKDHMSTFLHKNPAFFMEYASRDSVVTLLYSAALYGYNKSLPITITSASATIMKQHMMRDFDCETTEKFDRVYRGLVKMDRGKVKRDDGPGFIENSSLDPISCDVSIVQNFASQAYHGGYNICTEVGHFPYITYDYDLQNAYPVSMCMVMDVDYEAPIENEIKNRYLTLDDFMFEGEINPLVPFVAYVEFEFPSDVKYPCIPINVAGVPAYPLSSHGLDGVYVAGPSIYLALELGAKVYCKRGYILKVLYRNDKPSKSLSGAVKQLVVDRRAAKRKYGKNSLEELILKTLVSCGYGKTAQNVIQKTTWSAYKNEMEELGCSSITNPVAAMMITSIIQAVLIAAQNQLEKAGFVSCSVTTDGMISNCPEDIMKSLDLLGLRKYMEQARLFLTDGADPEIWEIKHIQDDLVNFVTRGNVSLRCKENPVIYNGKEYEGVCAHNSVNTPYTSDTYKDRLWLMTKVISRMDKVVYKEKEWTKFKELVAGAPFYVKNTRRSARMDFDCKRKPDLNSFKTDLVTVEGCTYEIAHFDTLPYQGVDEFREYRERMENSKVLRTEKDWEVYFLKLGIHESKAKPRNKEWAILNSCIMGYRMGLWDIPELCGKKVEKKCEWINEHNTSGKEFKLSDWKNTRRNERQVNMLPPEMLLEKLAELGAVSKVADLEPSEPCA